MMSALQLLGLLGAAFGVIGAAVSVALYTRGSYAKAKIDGLRADLEDEQKASDGLRKRIVDLEAEQLRCRERVSVTEKQITILTDENRTLRSMPEVAVQAIASMVESNFASNATQMAALGGRLDTVTTNLADVTSNLADVTRRLDAYRGDQGPAL